MGGEFQADAVPGDIDVGVMAFGFGQSGHAVDEVHRRQEVLELELPGEDVRDPG